MSTEADVAAETQPEPARTPAPTAPVPWPRRGRTALLVLAIAWLGLVPVRSALESARDDATLRPQSLDEAPNLRQTALTSGIGGVRAIMNLMTFSAINQAERDREYYRMLDLAEEVLVLQPRNPAIISYVARQMIDTISRTEADPDRRFAWMLRGLEVLMTARERNPQSSLLHQEISLVYQEAMSKMPERMLTYDLQTAGRHGMLIWEPAWYAEGEALLADLQALSEEESARLQAAINSIGSAVIYTDTLSTFADYRSLSRESQGLFTRIQAARERMELLAYTVPFGQARPIEGTRSRMAASSAGYRVRNLLRRARTLPVAERREESIRIWRWGVRLWEWVGTNPIRGDERRADTRRATHTPLVQSYASDPLPAGTITRDGVDLLAHYFATDEIVLPAAGAADEWVRPTTTLRYPADPSDDDPATTTP